VFILHAVALEMFSSSTLIFGEGVFSIIACVFGSGVYFADTGIIADCPYNELEDRIRYMMQKDTLSAFWL